MNLNTLTGSAKLHKKIGIYATGQMVTDGEVPNIAIITTLNPYDHKRLVESVGFGVRSSGGAVSVFYTTFFGSSNKINPMTAKFTQSFRQTAVSNAQAIIKTNLIDGVVAVTDCEITASGIIEACSRANCPVLILSTGVGAESCNMAEIKPHHILGAVAGGRLNAKQGKELISNAHLPKDIGADFNSVSTFFILAECFGFAMAGAGSGIAGSGMHYRTAVATGEQICKNAKDVLSPKKFLTRGALNNAITLMLAIGGNVSALSHWKTLVSQHEDKLPHDMISEISAKTPLLVAPVDANCAFLRNIGVNRILKQLSSIPKLIDETVLTTNGEKLRTINAEVEPATLEPASKTASVVLCKGTAATSGGFAQPNPATPTVFSGKAWVYDDLESADKALLTGSIPNGSIVVVRNCVDNYITCLVHTIEGMQKTKDIAIITDGLCEKSDVLVVTQCTPSGLANEEFANIQNGDQLEIDLGRGRLATNILAKEIKGRQKKNSVRKEQFYF